MGARAFWAFRVRARRRVAYARTPLGCCGHPMVATTTTRACTWPPSRGQLRVVATATIYGDEAAIVATTVKLGRTLWLIPLAFAVSLIYRSSEARLRVPGFILLFIAAAVLGSFIPMSDALLGGISALSKALLVVALGMIGLEINRATLSQISWRSIALGMGLWILVAPAALLLVLWF